MMEGWIFMSEKLKVLDLFSGIGGFSLGLERTGGFETVAFCEIEKHSKMILKKNWPKVKQYDDITSAKFTENVDLVTAGFPCQDLSFQGAAAGLTGERSGLFWYIIRTLCMVGRPRVLLENVAALLDRGLGSVLGALAAFGYDAQWDCIPAGAIGAPHERDRIWINAANSTSKQGLYEPNHWQRTYRLPDNGSAWKACPWNAPEECVCRMDDGLSYRVYRSERLGNTIVPQIPEMIGYAILEAEKI